MAILSVTAAAKAAGISRTTIYEKIKDGELSRTPEGIDTVELLRVFGELKSEKSGKPEAQASEPAGDTMTLWLREKLDVAERELKATRDELADTTDRLQEHRDAARLLEHKNSEWESRSTKWKQALEQRKSEIESARHEAAELSDQLKREADERAKAESRARALEGRGLIARLLNRNPEVV